MLPTSATWLAVIVAASVISSGRWVRPLASLAMVMAC
jgi:hypothetical protein